MSNTSSEPGGRGKRAGTQATSGSSKGAATSSALEGGSQASATIGEGAREAKEQAATVADSAKDLASRAGEKLRSSAEEQKAAGADYVSGVAGSMRRAADEFNNVPQAAQYMRLAADQIDSVSDAFRKRDVSQLVADVQDFARQQPTAFIGAAVLAGFAAVRFLKTSSAGAYASNVAYSSTQQGAGAPFTSGDGAGIPRSQRSADGMAPEPM